MEVVPIDKNNKKLGAKLQLKQGYTKEDGSAFTRDDIIAFSRKSAAINQRMHGIYNKADRSAVQRLAIGRMGVMFRKWIRPSLTEDSILLHITMICKHGQKAIIIPHTGS